MGRGISPVLTTAILTGVLLTALGVAIWVSTSMIEYHTQATEYANAKNLLTYLADAVEQVALGTGGARYVRFSLRTSRLDFARSVGRIEVRVGGKAVIEDSVDALALRGGDMLGYVPTAVLYPEKAAGSGDELSRFLVRPGEPLTLVWEEWDRGPKTTLVCRRVRVSYLGVYRILEAGELRTYNVFEVAYINLTIGRTYGSGAIPVVVRSLNSTVEELVLGSNSVQVSVLWNGEPVASETLAGDPGADGTIILIRVARVEVSTE